MTEQLLLYLPDPYGVGNSKYAVAHAGGIEVIPGGQLADTIEEAICYDVMALVDDIRRSGSTLPPKLIDISEALRLSVGLSKSDGGEQKWSLWKCAKPHFNTTTDWKLAQALHEGRALHPQGDELIAYFGKLANALTSLWKATRARLSVSGEQTRFFDVEVPVAQIFYNRQLKGVPVDVQQTSRAIQQASSTKYDAYRSVTDALQVSATGLTYWNVSRHLKMTDLPSISDNVEGYALRDQLKIAAGVSTFAKSFTDYQSASQDVSILTRLSDAEGRVFPIFHPMGTISGRILVSDPHLQELRRRYRSSIGAEEGCDILYCDYSQFEPGIMASLSGDARLIELYNTGDIYASLSDVLFGSAEFRDLSKKIFLAFSYGMSAEGIAGLVLGKDSVQPQRDAVASAISEFFAQFQTLTEFKLNAERRLENDGYVSSLLGNHRRRTRGGALNAKEKRWSLSHTIQATASLIFKRALILINQDLGPDAVILPMHDAVVLQVPTDLYTEISGRVQAIMATAFVEHCPQLTVKVTTGRFDS